MQIASTTNATPLAATPATPGGNGPRGEDSPFGKILSAQKQPSARSIEAQQTRPESKPEAKSESASNETQAAEADASDAETNEASSSARRGAARNAPRIAVRGRDASMAKSDACQKPLEGDTHGPDGAKDVDKKDSDSNSAAAVNHSVPMPALPHTAADTAVMGSAATVTVNTYAATSSSEDAAVRATATATRGSQDSTRVAADDARRDAKFADTTASIADASESARRASNEKQLVGRKDMQDHVEQRLEVPSLHELTTTNQVAATHNAPRAESSAPPVAVAIATPATSPEFTEALGVQVSMLARDGIQHAELHLNPTDMGPISVQIALDGTRAQVDFGADSLATRQIIESGLPELASALRDAGFTLAGGGVSQHSHGQGDRQEKERQAGASASHRLNGSNVSQGPSIRGSIARMSQGGVDLYA